MYWIFHRIKQNGPWLADEGIATTEELHGFIQGFLRAARLMGADDEEIFFAPGTEDTGPRPELGFTGYEFDNEMFSTPEDIKRIWWEVSNYRQPPKVVRLSIRDVPEITDEQRQILEMILETEDQLMHITFAGWEDDPRDVPEIPEIRDWVQSAIVDYPMLLAKVDEATLKLFGYCCAQILGKETSADGRPQHFSVLYPAAWQAARKAAGLPPES